VGYKGSSLTIRLAGVVRLPCSSKPQETQGGKEMTDRLTYIDGKFTKYGEPVIDELVLHDAMVHLEILSDSCYMLIVSNKEHYWHLTIHSKSGRGNVVARLFEDNSRK